MRLLTISGPGGTGKTRLALQAAAEVAAERRFPDGITHGYRLHRCAMPRSSPFPDRTGAGRTGAAGGRARWEALVEAVQEGKAALLLLDNAEHLLPGVADVAARLARVGRPTGAGHEPRAAAACKAEQVWPRCRSSPWPRMQWSSSLPRRARLDARLPPSTTVEELCARLDHLPLAIELAAARTAASSRPSNCSTGSARRLDLLRGCTRRGSASTHVARHRRVVI